MSRILTSNGLAPSTENTARKLISKHPPRSSALSPSPNVSCESTTLSRSLLFNSIRQAPRGSGAGPSGCRFEHFEILLKNEDTADGLFSACSAFAKGILPNVAATLSSSSRLIALPKPNGDVRPIAIGESIRRLTARTICSQKRKGFLKFYVPFSMVCLRNVVQS